LFGYQSSRCIKHSVCNACESLHNTKNGSNSHNQMQLTQTWLQYYHIIANKTNSTTTIFHHCNIVHKMQQRFAISSKLLYLRNVSLPFFQMVAIQPSLAIKFSALQFRGIEFDTKPCSVVLITRTSLLDCVTFMQNIILMYDNFREILYNDRSHM
jgi:hypothetical protein